MKKYILLIAFLSLSFLSFQTASAGLLVTEDMDITDIALENSATNATILKGSETGSFFVSKGSFRVTNPSDFKVVFPNPNVKSIFLVGEDGKIVSCEENKKPGESFLNVTNLKGTYEIVPSETETCKSLDQFPRNKFSPIVALRESEYKKLVEKLGEDVVEDAIFQDNPNKIQKASFLDEMSDEDKERILLDLGKIAAFIIIGQIF